jgi:hypothetical protein
MAAESHSNGRSRYQYMSIAQIVLGKAATSSSSPYQMARF